VLWFIIETPKAKLKDGTFCANENEVVIGAAVAKTYDIKLGSNIKIEYLGENTI
jgi:hypothetical protein